MGSVTEKTIGHLWENIESGQDTEETMKGTSSKNTIVFSWIIKAKWEEEMMMDFEGEWPVQELEVSRVTCRA